MFGGAWTENTPPHLSQLPFKGDTVVGNDVWIGRDSVVMPGVHIGDGAIVAGFSVVTKDVEPYTLVGGTPARFILRRFSPELTGLLQQLCWWDLPPRQLADLLPVLCDTDLERAMPALRRALEQRQERGAENEI